MRHDAYRAKINSDLASIAAKQVTLAARATFLRSELDRITQDERTATLPPVAKPSTLLGPYVVCKDNARHVPDYLNDLWQFGPDKPRIFKQAKRAQDAAALTGGYVLTAPIWALKGSD